MAWGKRAKEQIDHALDGVNKRFGPGSRQKAADAIEKARKAGVQPLSILIAIATVLLSGGSLQKLIDAILSLIVPQT